MCGIGGYVGGGHEGLLDKMCRALAHRGPDAEGTYSEPGVGLAHRRLSIIDLENGRQPMADETGNLQVVFNGEIYNYRGLREHLQGRGRRFRTESDTETILHLYAEYGLGFAKWLRGMFAIALWDSVERRLVLLRDRIGEKPLYYAEGAGGIVFGSEIKAILPALSSRTVDPRAVCEYLAAGHVPAPRTFYKEIKKLGAAQMLVFEDGESHIAPYWSWEERSATHPSFREASAELERLLEESIDLCLKSDREVGAFLSGGLDSSLIVALMREKKARVKTFSVGYGGEAEGFNELGYARRVSERCGTDHHELILEAESSIDLLPRILWHYDEPHGEPTSVLVYLLCEFASREVAVAMGGTGGDEFFFGYPRHKGIRLLRYYNALPRVVRKQFVERIVARWPESTRGSRFAKRVKRFVLGSSLPPGEAYLNWVSLLHRDIRSQLVHAEVGAESDDPTGEVFLRDYLIGPGPEDLHRRAANLDIREYLPNYQLTYMDRMSMAHGLEVRSPLCDYRLGEFAAALPASFRLKGNRSKHILKEVSSRWLPGEIIDRRKVGFDSPVGEWFKHELRGFLESFLAEEHINRSGLLNAGAVKSLVGDHLSGRKDYSLQIWSIVALEAWFRMYIEGGDSVSSGIVLGDLRGAEVRRKSRVVE